MSGAIRNEFYKAMRLTKSIKHCLGCLQVRSLIVRTDEIHLSVLPSGKDAFNRIGMVCHKEPITLLPALPVNRDFFTAKCFSNNNREELGGILVRTVVIGTTGDAHPDAERTRRCEEHQIAGRLTGRIRIAWMQRIIHNAGWLIVFALTVDFIRRNMEEEQ